VPVTAGKTAVRRGQLGGRVAAAFNQDALTRKDDMTSFRKLCERIAFFWWYLTAYKPIAGADGSTDGGGSGDGGAGEGSAAGSDGGDGSGSGEGSGEGSGSGGDADGSQASGSGAGDDEDDSTVRVNHDEHERLKRKVAEQEKAERKRQREEAEKAGDHEKVVQQVEQERDDAIRERDEAREELATFKREGTVREVAERLKFHDTRDAIFRTPKEVAEKGEAAIERHLRAEAEKSPHLTGEGAKRSGASLTGGGNGGGEGGQLSSTEGMSPAQIVKASQEGRLDDYLKSK
jgi:hypothetical protein